MAELRPPARSTGSPAGDVRRRRLAPLPRGAAHLGRAVAGQGRGRRACSARRCRRRSRRRRCRGAASSGRRSAMARRGRRRSRTWAGSRPSPTRPTPGPGCALAGGAPRAVLARLVPLDLAPQAFPEGAAARIKLLQRRRVAAAPRGERDLSAHQVYASALEIVDGALLRCGEQSEPVIERARFVLGLGRSQRALRALRGSSVSAAARSRKAAAAAKPPRDWARPAARSSSAATSSSRPPVASARCQARGSGSTSGSVASANARCTVRRSSCDAAW